jgi:hypothetical protein
MLFLEKIYGPEEQKERAAKSLSLNGFSLGSVLTLMLLLASAFDLMGALPVPY